MSNLKNDMMRSAREISKKIKINVEEEFRIVTDMVLRIEAKAHTVISKTVAFAFALTEDCSLRPLNEMPELLQEAIKALDQESAVPFEQLQTEDSRVERLEKAINRVFDVFTSYLAANYIQIRKLSSQSWRSSADMTKQVRQIRSAVLGQVERVKNMLDPIAEHVNNLTESREQGETKHLTHIGKAAIARWQTDIRLLQDALSHSQTQTVSAAAQK